jgi:hypothetical protein
VGFQRAIDYQPPRWPEPGIPQQSHLDFSVPDLDEGGVPWPVGGKGVVASGG